LETTKQGSGTSVYGCIASIDIAARVKKYNNGNTDNISDNEKSVWFHHHPYIPYLVPYYLPCSWLLLESINLYSGPQWSGTTLTKHANQTAKSLWEYSEDCCIRVCK
jgi:hypothetical protein